MRWNAVFDDLEAQLAEQERAELRAEVADRTRRERAALTLADRLAASLGAALAVRLRGGASLRGTLAELGQDWLLLEQAAGGAAVVRLAALATVDGLAPRADARESVSRRRYGIGVVLRELSRDRGVVRVHLGGDVVVEGRVAAVGADHLDLLSAGGDLVGRPRGARPTTVCYAAADAVVYR